MREPWICNECGSRQFTGNVAEHDLQWLACSRCGGAEFHKPIRIVGVGMGTPYPATERDEDSEYEYAREDAPLLQEDRR